MTYTNFERDLIEWIIEQLSEPTLATQLRAATVTSREYTGAGLFLRLDVPGSARQPLPPGLRSPISGPQIAASSIPNGAGTLLFHEDGIISLLEVYTYTDSLTAELSDYRLHAG